MPQYQSKSRNLVFKLENTRNLWKKSIKSEKITKILEQPCNNEKQVFVFTIFKVPETYCLKWHTQHPSNNSNLVSETEKIRSLSKKLMESQKVIEI